MPYFANLRTKEQKDYYMPKLVSGEMVSAIGMTEPGIESEFKFSDVYKFIFRRRKIIGYATGLVFLTTLFYTFYQRIYDPLYNGTFWAMSCSSNQSKCFLVFVA